MYIHVAGWSDFCDQLRPQYVVHGRYTLSYNENKSGCSFLHLTKVVLRSYVQLHVWLVWWWKSRHWYSQDFTCTDIVALSLHNGYFIGWMIGTTSVIFSFNWGIIHTPPPPPSYNITIKVSTYSATEVSHHRHSLTKLHGYPELRIPPRLCNALWHYSSWILYTRHCVNVSWRSSRPS